MHAELNAAWWKKNKAKTLLSEPLTKSLEALDKARANMDASPSREHMSALTGATKATQAAITQTVSKCNAKIHKDTITYLKDMEAHAKAAYGILQTEQQSFAKLLGDYQKLRDAVADLLSKAVAAPNPTTVGTADKGVKAMLTWMNAHKTELSSNEVALTFQWIGKTEIALKDAVAFVNEQPPNAKLPFVMKEVEAQIPRIVAPGGFEMPKGGAISNKPFGQG